MGDRGVDAEKLVHTPRPDGGGFTYVVEPYPEVKGLLRLLEHLMELDCCHALLLVHRIGPTIWNPARPRVQISDCKFGWRIRKVFSTGLSCCRFSEDTELGFWTAPSPLGRRRPSFEHRLQHFDR